MAFSAHLGDCSEFIIGGVVLLLGWGGGLPVPNKVSEGGGGQNFTETPRGGMRCLHTHKNKKRNRMRFLRCNFPEKDQITRNSEQSLYQRHSKLLNEFYEKKKIVISISNPVSKHQTCKFFNSN